MSVARSGILQRFSPRRLPRQAAAALLAVIVVVALVASHDAEARRFGGSRSFGRQSGAVSQHYQAPSSSRPQPSPATAGAPAAAAPAAAAAAAPARNRWMGPLAGIAAGLGIGALLSHFGMGGALGGMLGNILVIAIIAMVLMWLFRLFTRRRDAQTPAYAASGAGRQPWAEPVGRAPPVTIVPPTTHTLAGAAAGVGAAAAGANAQPWGIPADFDSNAFLRNAKVYFVRLQAAWDAGDLDDLREFTTPEMFAEARLDLSERGTSANQTDVVQLDADLLGIEERPLEHLASVRFTGTIREQQGAAAAPFTEVWNLSKRRTSDGTNEGWLLAGIQQVN